MGAGLADALQDRMHCLQVANMKNWQLQLDVAYTSHTWQLNRPLNAEVKAYRL